MAAFDPTQITAGAQYIYIGHSALDAVPDQLPDDDVLLGEDWGGTWRGLGWTTPDGFAFGGLSPETTPVPSAQQRPAVTHLAGNSEETVAFTLIEATMQNIMDMAGRGELSTTAPGASTYGHTDLTLGDATVRYVAIGSEVYGVDGLPRRMMYPIGIMRITGDLSQTFTQEMRIPAQFMRAGGANGNPTWRQVLAPTG